MRTSVVGGNYHTNMGVPRGYVRAPLEERFAAKVRKTRGCWHWLAYLDHEGYGRIRGFNGRRGESLYAHRVSYELHVGPISEGLHIDHLCRNRACVNPHHLEAVTCKVNISRGAGASILNSGRCRRGHDMKLEGYVRRDGRGMNCRACRRERRAGQAYPFDFKI